MDRGESVWRAVLPEKTHQWAVMTRDALDSVLRYNEVLLLLPERTSQWTPIPMEVVAPLHWRRARRAALPFTYYSNVLILRDEAIESVGGVLAPHSEVLPLAGRNADLALFTAPLLEDALVESESELFSRVASDDVRLIRGVFDRDVVLNHHAFVVAFGRTRQLLFTGSIKRRLEDTGDTSGVRLEEVGVVR